MDRDWLERWLGEGLSFERIAMRVGKDPSTVAYWARKYGLESRHRVKHVARGALTREQLEPLVALGFSTREIAVRLERSQSTVRHWLCEYGLKTHHARRDLGRASASKAAGLGRLELDCRRHGRTTFWLDGQGSYRCLRCRSEAVSRRRRKVKATIVEEAGGRCALCGYDRSVAAMHFHHLNPAEKTFGLGARGHARALATVRREARKCVLLCANCHAEVEAGVVRMGAAPGPPG